MKQVILICLLAVCVMPSFAISKKEIIQQKEDLLEKIQKEYVFVTNFDSIVADAKKEFDNDFNMMMEKVKKISAARYISRDAAPPEYAKIWNEKEVEEFRLKLICTDYYNGNKLKPEVPSMHAPWRYGGYEPWNAEWENINKKYPEIEEIDKILIKKKIATIWDILHDKWKNSFERVETPNIRDLVIQYNEKEKERIRKGYKEQYIEEQARNNEIQKKQAEKDREYYRSISARHNDKWYEGTWLGATNGHIEAAYIIKISSSQLRILYHNSVVYNGSYSVKGGYSDGYQRIVFGGGYNAIVLDSSRNTIEYNGYNFWRQ